MDNDKSNNAATDGKDDSSEIKAARESVPATNSPKGNLEAEPKMVIERSDDVAKQQGRSIVAAKPGAYSSTSIPSSDESTNPQIRNLEADILAKQRASAPKMSPEEDIIAKQKGRHSISADMAKPGAYSAPSSLNALEVSISDKQRGFTGGNARLSLDQDIAAKISGAKTSSSDININPALRNMEADIAAKRRAGASYPKSDIAKGYSSGTSDADTALQRLESAISAKQANFQTDVASNKASLNALSPRATNVDSDDAITKQQNEKGGSTDFMSAENGKDNERNTIKNDGQIRSALQQHDLEYGELVRDDNEGLGLAVALAVEEDDANIYLPSAVEFDPDAKPPMHRNRRFRLYVCLLIAAAVVGTVGAVLGIVLTAPEDQPQVSVPYRATIGIRENLERIVSPELLDDYNSPYKKAMDWITYTDPMALTPDSPSFLNRFVLAYLFYATSQMKPWTSECAPSESDGYNCIYAYLRETVDLTFVNSTAFKWLSNTNECQWAGVECDTFNQIRTIGLSFVGMSGTFPDGLALLPYLQKVDLRYSELSGPLPVYMASWKSLVDIRLQHSAFTGTFPNLWLESRNIARILLDGNQITGKLPGNISKLEDLVEFSVSSNKMTGNLPTEMGKMVNLHTVELDSNDFNGPIPTTFGNLFHALVLDISQNSITGTIPEAIVGCNTLSDLFLFNNLLTGPLPSGFWDMANLAYVKIGSNKLTGTIGNAISKLIYLRDLEIENNHFNGSFPFRLTKNVKLKKVRAYGNSFTGNVSTEVCKLVERGQIRDLEFDCSVPLYEGTPEIFCPNDCCTVCCNPDGKECVEQ